MSEQEQVVFNIERVYIKDVSLEIPHAPQIFLQPETPTVDIRLHNATQRIDGGLFEVVLTATVTAKLKEKTAFLVEVAQAGIFQIRNFEPADLDRTVNVTCPRVLLPYAREAVSSLLGRAGFPPINLPHVGFETLYMEQRQEQEKQAAAPAAVPGA
jgi:preprotein translocase subunit SecB